MSDRSVPNTGQAQDWSVSPQEVAHFYLASELPTALGKEVLDVNAAYRSMQDMPDERLWRLLEAFSYRTV